MKYNIKNPKDSNLNIRADRTFLARLNQLSDKRQMSVSKIIRTLIEKEYLNEFPKSN
jgi:hypothetical protein